MKILRVVNGVPVEFELTPEEIYEIYANQNMNIAKSNLLWALESEQENDDPDTDDPFSAKEILAMLKRNPLLTMRVAKEYNDLIDELCTYEHSVMCAIDAYRHVISRLEVCK